MSDAITMSVQQGQWMGVVAVLFLVFANALVLVIDKWFLEPKKKEVLVDNEV